MLGTGVDLDNGRQTGHSDGRQPCTEVSGSAVAELAIIVGAPALDLAAADYSACVGTAATDL